MQVANTLWPDRKYQSAESGSNGPSIAQEPSSDHSRHAKTNGNQTRQPRTTHQPKLGAVSGHGPSADLVGRPSHGPHRLSSATRRSSIGSPCRFLEKEAVAPFYKYRRIENENTHTPHLSSQGILA